MSKIIESFDQVKEAALYKMKEAYSNLPNSYWSGKSAYTHRFDNFRNMIDRKEHSQVYSKEQIEDISNSEMLGSSKIALYFGVPWCIQSCSFCDLAYSRKPNRKEKHDYIDNILKEIEIRSNATLCNKLVASAYFGGGTPSILDADILSDYIDRSLSAFNLDKSAVVTLEASPATLNSDKLEAMKSHISRISLGVQSTDTELRIREGRILKREKLLSQIALTLEHFALVNVDVLYGMRGQTFESIYVTLTDLIELGVPSITYYRMELFQGTKSYEQSKEECWPAVEEHYARKMYFFGKYLLEESGYTESPLGWFVKSKQSKETLPWTKMVESWGKVLPYYGFGVGAFSTSSGYWMQNGESINEWRNNVMSGRLPIGRCIVLDEMERFAVKIMRHIRAFKKIKLSFLNDYEILDLKNLRRFFEVSISQGLFDIKGEYIELTQCGESLIHWVLDDLTKVLVGGRLDKSELVNAILLD